MIIYIECVLFNNIAINSLIIYLTLLVLKRSVKWWRIAISSIVGAVYALFYPIIQFKGDIAIKFLIALVMCVFSTKILSVKKLSAVYLTFLGITFAFGGTIEGIMNMWQPFRETMSNPSNINIGLMSTIFLTALLFARKLIKIVQNKHISEGNVKQVIINKDKRIFRGKAYYDSGNTLYYKGIYPVIVMDESLKKESNSAVGSINVQTVCGNSVKEVYKLDKIVVDNRIYDSVYCVYNKLVGNYKILLHNDTY